MIYDVIILGSGPAGLTAAIYASRAFLKTLILSGNKKGGQLMDTTLVENYPGFPDGVMGPDLMQKMEAQAKKFNTEIINEEAVDIDFLKRPFTVNGKYQGKSIIIATGASHKKLELAEEEKFWGHGLSYCATCDGFFFRDKVIAVVGGGDTAMEEAIFLTKFGKKVYIIHRRAEFRASRIMVERVLKNPKIEIIWNRTVSKLVGVSHGKPLQKLVLASAVGEPDMELLVDGLFVAIGLKPNTEFLKGKIELDEKGYVLKNSKFETRNSKCFDKLSISSKAEGQIRNSNHSNSKLDSRRSLPRTELRGGTNNTIGIRENPLEIRENQNENKTEIQRGQIMFRNMTSIPGVFVAGDVADPFYRQAVTAAGDGCAAALEIEKYLEENR